MLLSSASVTGPAEVCLDDAKALRDSGHRVVMGCDTRRPGNYAEAIAQAGLELDRKLVCCPKPTPAEVIKDVFHLRARFAATEFDLVHARFAHDHALALLALAALRGRPPLVRTVEIARSLRPGLFRSQSLRRSDAVIVSNSEYRRRIVDLHGVPSDRVEVIPGRVDRFRFTPGDGDAFRHWLAVPRDAVVFGIVSRIKPERLHVPLVRGFAQAAATRPKAHLAIVGRGEGEPAVREAARRSGLEDRIHFAGYWSGDELVGAYRGLDAAVWLAEGNDGTCRGVLEAMSCGKPVIGARVGAIAEAIVDGETGYLIDPNNPETIGRAIGTLADDKGLRERLGVAGRRRAESDFAPEARTRRLVSFYERILARGRGER